jgi:hypothetical protein
MIEEHLTPLPPMALAPTILPGQTFLDTRQAQVTIQGSFKRGGKHLMD